MKNLIKAAMLAMAIAATGASSSGMCEAGSRTIIVILDPEDQEGRPKAPSRQQIQCAYDDANLTISFLIDEGSCTLVVSSPEHGAETFSFDSESTAIIPIGHVSSADLEILTEKGNTYVGAID